MLCVLVVIFLPPLSPFTRICVCVCVCGLGSDLLSSSSHHHWLIGNTCEQSACLQRSSFPPVLISSSSSVFESASCQPLLPSFLLLSSSPPLLPQCLRTPHQHRTVGLFVVFWDAVFALLRKQNHPVLVLKPKPQVSHTDRKTVKLIQ